MEDLHLAGFSTDDQEFLREIDADPTMNVGDKDMLLFNKYLQTRNKYVLTELINALMPLALRMASKYKRGGVVSDGHFKVMVLKNIGMALQNYDPSQGAKLSTYVANCMIRLMRDMTKSMNMVNMGEQQTYDLPKLRTAADQLRDNLDRDPTHAEIANHYNRTLKDQGKFVAGKAWDADRVKQLFDRDYRDHYESNNALTTANNTFDQSDMVLNYIREHLTPEERTLFEDLNKELSGNEITAKMGDINVNRLNYVKKKLVEKVDRLRREMGQI